MTQQQQQQQQCTQDQSASWILGLHLADKEGSITETPDRTPRSQRDLEDQPLHTSFPQL